MISYVIQAPKSNYLYIYFYNFNPFLFKFMLGITNIDILKYSNLLHKCCTICYVEIL